MVEDQLQPWQIWKRIETNPPCAPTHDFQGTWACLGAVHLIQIFDTLSRLEGVRMRTISDDQ